MKAVILHNASVLLISGFEVPKGHQSCRGVVKPHRAKLQKKSEIASVRPNFSVRFGSSVKSAVR